MDNYGINRDGMQAGICKRLWRALFPPRYERRGRLVELPQAPRNASPVPGLTSLHATRWRGNYGDHRYPGNCGGYLIKDLLRYFQPKRVFDPMAGSGTCRDVCKELGIKCVSKDLRTGFDACDEKSYPIDWDEGAFDFIWAHPPYYRQKVYSDDPRDLSTAPTLEAFLERYGDFIRNCSRVLSPGGHLAILMGDYMDAEYGFLPLVYLTKQLCFRAGLRQSCTDIIRFSYGASSAGKEYRSKFIPGLHDVVTVTELDQRHDDRKEDDVREVAQRDVIYLNGGSAEDK